jgi:hypothetical protein
MNPGHLRQRPYPHLRPYDHLSQYLPTLYRQLASVYLLHEQKLIHFAYFKAGLIINQKTL